MLSTPDQTVPGPPPTGMPSVLNLAPRDVVELADELIAYHALFAPLFHRFEQRHWALKYLQGQMLDLERKSVEPMALALEGGNIQALQQFISDGAWDDDTILEAHQRLVAETLGDPETGVLIIDGCEFPKQGKESVGVAPQYCGPLGKIANCQASVVAGYASRRGYTLVDRHLYLPERWFGDEYEDRWEKCDIPRDVLFRNRHQLAAAMITALHQRGVLPFRWVACDEHFGMNTRLLDQIADLGVCYFAEVPHDTLVWTARPDTEVPPAKERGRKPRQVRLRPDEPRAIRVAQLAEHLSPVHWQRETIKEGTKGPLVAEFAFVRVVAMREKLPGPEVWVVFRRSLDATRELKVYLSNAPAETPVGTLVWLCGMRWPVEAAIEECKGELGMDHYELRGWRGWHHHVTMAFLAHHFLVRLRRRLREKGGRVNRAPSPSAADGGPAPSAA